VLSIYLNIDGSATPNPSGPPAFQYNNGGVGIPVPQGHTGSLILSREYLTRNYFLQAFSRIGFSNMTPTGDALSPISFSGSYHKATTVYGNKVDVSFSFSELFSGFDSADYGAFHVDDYQFSFTLNNDNTLTISSGQVATATIPVYIHYTIGGGTHGVTQHLTDYRTTWATLSINKGISFSAAQPSAEGFALSFSVNQNDYAVSSSSDIGGVCDDHTQRDVEAKLRQALGDIAPGITVKLPELETFVIDNMLFNGAVKFKLDPKSKMNFPHDLLLVGSLG
jgi:hypothetical protein